jgi:hypothetical protein
MKHDGYRKAIGIGILFVLTVSTVGAIGSTSWKNTPQPLGILEYEPKSHDFGKMYQGVVNSTVFEIWTSGGCCELIYNLTWDCSWVTVFPTSGTSNGEHDPITVTVDTSGLDNGINTCDILITTNGGGDGIFNVTLEVIHAIHPLLAFTPQTHDFGMIAQNKIETTSFDIWNSGNGTLNYTISSTKNWVSVSPLSGSSVGEHDPITVMISTNGLQNDTTYLCDVQITSNGGNDIFTLSVTVGTMPTFEIKSIEAGLFRIKTTITNTGTAVAAGVDWKITLYGNGLILHGKQTTGTITSLPIGAEQTIVTGMIFGFGDVMVLITFQNADAVPLVKILKAKLIFFYIQI